MPSGGSYACVNGPLVHGTIVGVAKCNLDGHGAAGLPLPDGSDPILQGQHVLVFVYPSVGVKGWYVHVDIGGETPNTFAGNSPDGAVKAVADGYSFDHLDIGGGYTTSGFLACRPG
jgi:hypothetical protein